MGIKRPLMILGSTVGAVAAVLSYHPAASGESAFLNSTPVGGSDTPTETSTPTPQASESAAPNQAATPTPTASASATPTAKPSAKATSAAKKKSATTTKKSSSSSSSANATTADAGSSSSTSGSTADTGSTATESAPTPTPTPTPKVAKDQVVTGATAQTRWGPVQVQITVKDGKIVDATALQYPNGDRRSQWISQQAVPWLIEETLAEQRANVQNIGGATYTTAGWRQSLASAMQKAGL